jgi:hypothetical protein
MLCPLCGLWGLQLRLGSRTCTVTVGSGVGWPPSRFGAAEKTVLIVFEERMHTYTHGCTGGFLVSFFVFFITYTLWMIYMQVKEVSRKAEKWSIRMVCASIPASPSRMEAMQSPARNINDGSVHTRSQNLEAASDAW